MQKLSPPDSTSWTWGEAEACFVSETCGMVMQFSVISTYDTQGGGDAADLGVAAIPHEDGLKASDTIAYANAVMFLSKDEAKRKASQKFISWLLEPENYGKFLNMEPGLFMPVTEDGAKADSFWNDPMVQKYKTQIETDHRQLARTARSSASPAAASSRRSAPISAQNLSPRRLQDVVSTARIAKTAVAEGQARMVEASK